LSFDRVRQLGKIMSGVIEGMRRTLLSCTSIVRAGAVGLGASALAGIAPAFARDDLVGNALTILSHIDRQEVAALSVAAAVLGFSVVAAILLMRTRLRAARTEAHLLADNQALQLEADRFRALLFAEPQVLISWAAGDDRPDVSGDVAMLMPQGADQFNPQRILAFGSWLLPEQALTMDHAIDNLRDAGEGFQLNLHTAAGRTIEAMGRAIGGQAIVRIRELSGVRMELAALNIRHSQLLEETGALRAFAEPFRFRSGHAATTARSAFANAAYAQAADARSVADAIERNLELLDHDDRASMAKALARHQSFEARVPIVTGGQRRMFDICALNVIGGSAGIAVDATEAASLRAALERMAEAHRRMLDQLSSGVAVFDASRRLTFYNDSYRRLWDLDRAFLDDNPDDSSVLDRLRVARKIRTGRFPRLEEQAVRGLSRHRACERHLVSSRRPRTQRRHHAQSGRRRHVSLRRRDRKPEAGTAE
jgi:PAS domain-containing protein